MLRYLSSLEIDKTKWDHCIQTSPQGLVYAFSWYLDHVSVQWGALVYGDYEAVFPLPWKQKYFLKYIYQPFFTQQLGWFSVGNTPSLEETLKAIPSRFLHLNLNLQGANNELSGFKNINPRKNYLLPLGSSYETLYANYSANHKKNIKKSLAENLHLQTATPTDAIQLYREIYGPMNPKIQSHDYEKLEKLLIFALKEKKALCLSVVSTEGEVCAIGCFLLSHNRISYVLGAPTPLGRGKNAVYFLLDSIIQQYSHSNYTLDFEGSEIPGVEYFYKNFGAITETYYHIEGKRLFFGKWF